MALRQRKGGWAVVYRDEHGRQQTASGFKTKGAAREWESDQLRKVRARKRGDVVVEREEPKTVDVLADEFLAHHPAHPNTVRTLKERLKPLRDQFGDVLASHVTPAQMFAWFGGMEAGRRYRLARTAKQFFRYCEAIGQVAQSPVAAVKAEEPAAPKFEVFSRAEVDAICREMRRRDAALVTLLFETGLRPEEAIALERKHVNRERGVLHVQRTYVRGELHEGKAKTKGSLREVPLSRRAIEALDSLPPHLQIRLLFAGARGSFVNWHNWRVRIWKSALDEAGVVYRSPYALRHSYISRSLAAGNSILETAQNAGTSVRMIERTYGRKLADSNERYLERMAALEAAEAVKEEAADA